MSVGGPGYLADGVERESHPASFIALGPICVRFVDDF